MKYYIHQKKGIYFVFIINDFDNESFIKIVNNIKNGVFKEPPVFYDCKISECESFIRLDNQRDTFLDIKS